MSEFNTITIINIAKLHWKKLAIVAIVAIVLSSFFSSPLFLAPKYKSIAVVFPSNLTSFSLESNTEQLLQFLHSEELKNNIAKRFNLFKHYNIDSSDAKAVSKFNDYYKTNISMATNMYESVEIEVIDESQSLAQSMANGIIDEANKLIRESKRNLVSEYLKNYSNQLIIKKTEIDSLKLRLQKMRRDYNLIDVKAQSKVLSKRIGGSMSETDNKVLKALQEHGDEFMLLQSSLKIEMESYKDLKLNYDKNQLDYNGKLSYTTIISKANFPDKKCAPLRAVIVILTTLSALLLALTILLFNNRKQL